MVRKQHTARVLLAEIYDVDLKQKVARATEPDGQPLDRPYDTPGPPILRPAGSLVYLEHVRARGPASLAQEMRLR